MKLSDLLEKAEIQEDMPVCYFKFYVCLVYFVVYIV